MMIHTALWSYWPNKKMSSATLRNRCMTIPAVWDRSADRSRLEVHLHWRLRRRSWCVSDWRETY